MANGGNMSDWLSKGSGAPSTPSVPSGATAAYLRTSNNHAYFWDGAAWQDITGGGGGGGGAPIWSWVTKSANYTATTSDTGILVDATGSNITITLPTAVASTALYAVKKKDSSAHTVAIATTSSQTIDGLSGMTLAAQDEMIVLASDGANWYVVAFGTESESVTAALSANVTITTGGTFYDSASITPPAGEWWIDSWTTAQPNGAGYVTGKLWDGTTVINSFEFAASSTFQHTASLAGRVVTDGTKTYKVSVTCTNSTSLILAAAAHSGAGNNASGISAIRIGA